MEESVGLGIFENETSIMTRIGSSRDIYSSELGHHRGDLIQDGDNGPSHFDSIKFKKYSRESML
jgi:hypothetical protein